LLVTTAVAVIVLAACTSAWAGEPDADGNVSAPAAPPVGPAAAPADTTALARTAVAEGELEAALRVLARVTTSDRPEDERAAAA
jgi:hypothetical protein